ncbi:MAG: hypothetical protein FD167_230 [bacterium]|nr:MAG: hypothetical protein FD167_230 [bacterium]
MLKKIVSGEQIGVDKVTLDVALSIPIGLGISMGSRVFNKNKYLFCGHFVDN